VRKTAVRGVLLSLCLLTAGCSGGGGSAAPTVRVTALRPRGLTGSRNPGTGTPDPRVARALLTRFEDARDDLPGAVVAPPVADRGSLFIGLRQVSSPLDAPGCDRWTAGFWRALLDTFNVRGVQLGVTRLQAPLRGGRPLTFSEAIITGPAVALGDPRVPAACAHLRGVGGSGAVEALAVPPLGDRSWAYRVTGTGTIPVWQWVEVVRTPAYLLEVRIPKQLPAPPDPAALLPRITRAAWAKAERALR
jgi:hypothetical protein